MFRYVAQRRSSLQRPNCLDRPPKAKVHGITRPRTGRTTLPLTIYELWGEVSGITQRNQYPNSCFQEEQAGIYNYLHVLPTRNNVFLGYCWHVQLEVPQDAPECSAGKALCHGSWHYS